VTDTEDGWLQKLEPWIISTAATDLLYVARRKRIREGNRTAPESGQAHEISFCEGAC